MRFPRPLLAASLLAAGLVAAAPATSAAAESVSLPPTGSLAVTANGNGHGHGLSQYGARGAAAAGLSADAITAFYYPGTQLTRLRWSTIRVRLSGFGWTVTVSNEPTLTVTGVGTVGTVPGVAKWRLVADAGSTYTLQYLRAAPGASWTTYRAHLGGLVRFQSTDGAAIRLWRPDGSSVAYLGRIRAVRSAATGAHGVYPVNRTTLDRYVAGVVPREMPASWPQAAVQAQAIAARSYARYAVEHPRGGAYDICDTTMCQVYGGHVVYDATGRVQWTDYAPAALATANLVRTYRGATIFAQFSASNGGWTVAGGQPYLVARADPYDGPASGDPYLGDRSTVSAASLARSFGLAKVTGVTITKRDGRGAWGGRVLAGYVTGTDAAGHVTRVAVDGFDLQYALGVGTTWFTLSPA